MKSYRIKKGSCLLSSERIMLEETLSGYVSHLLDLWRDGDRSSRAAFVVSIFALFFSLSFVVNYLVVGSFIRVTFFTAGLLSVLALSEAHMRLYGFTRDKFIEKEDVQSVKFNKGIRWLTCPRFIVNYEEDGEEKKRYVVMPTHLLPGVEEDIDGLKAEFEDLGVEVDW
jgi:hypothetical protein